MSIERQLCPLWEREPKNQGFRITIPDPIALHEFVIRSSEYYGDIPQEELDKQLDSFFIGERETELGVHLWGTYIGDRVIDEIEILLEGNYSPETGEWADLSATVSLSNEEMLSRLVQRFPLFRERLVNQGFPDTQLRITEDEEYKCLEILIESPENNLTAIVFSVSDSTEEAADQTLGYPVHIYLDEEIPLKPVGFLRTLQYFQHTVPYILDTIYETLDFQPPEVLIELSIK